MVWPAWALTQNQSLSLPELIELGKKSTVWHPSGAVSGLLNVSPDTSGTMHICSKVQVGLQPSPGSVPPSSHCSPGSSLPSPHTDGSSVSESE
jgi:hypothetical protein